MKPYTGTTPKYDDLLIKDSGTLNTLRNYDNPLLKEGNPSNLSFLLLIEPSLKSRPYNYDDPLLKNSSLRGRGIGVFLTKDPILFEGDTTNIFEYSSNDPVNWIDPDGLKVLNPNNYKVSDTLMETLRKLNVYIGCGLDIVITSGNRPSDTGQHGKGTAVDIKVQGQDHLTTANQAIRSGLFGGIGWYQEGWSNPNKPGTGPHVHVDLRDNKRLNPDVWGYDINNRYYNWESGGIPKISPPSCPCK